MLFWISTTIFGDKMYCKYFLSVLAQHTVILKTFRVYTVYTATEKEDSMHYSSCILIWELLLYFCQQYVAQRWLLSFLASLPVCRAIDQLYFFGFSADEVQLCLVLSSFSQLMLIPTTYFFLKKTRHPDFQSESNIRAHEHYVEWISIMWYHLQKKKSLYNTAF